MLYPSSYKHIPEHSQRQVFQSHGIAQTCHAHGPALQGPMTSRPHAMILLILLTVGAALMPTQVQAHPHVYVDTSLTFELSEKGLDSINQRWLFDEIFSNAVMSDLGVNAETLPTTIGQEKIRDGAFNYLGNYGYFTFIENNGKRIPVKETRGFTASLEEGRLVYNFSVPLNLPIDEISNLRVAVFDKEYYSDILLMKDDIAFEIDGMVQVSHVIRPAKDQTYWQFIVPEAIHLSIAEEGGAPTDFPEEELMEVESPGPIEQLMTMVRNIQKELTLKLNGFGMDIRTDPFGKALWMFLGLSFLYGIVHAVGPGHGKTVVCSYFLANPGSFFSGAVMGNVITFVHMGSAAVAVSIAYLVFSTGMGGFAEASRALQPASYALLALMGIFLTIKAVYDLSKGGMLAEATCEGHIMPGKGDNMRRVLTVSMVTGLVPCPGAAVILAFSIGQNVLWAGVAAILAMAIGMGITTTLFAWAAVALRTATLRLSNANKTIFNWVYAILSICGAAGIALFGAALFMSSNVWH